MRVSLMAQKAFAMFLICTTASVYGQLVICSKNEDVPCRDLLPGFVSRACEAIDCEAPFGIPDCPTWLTEVVWNNTVKGITPVTSGAGVFYFEPGSTVYCSTAYVCACDKVLNQKKCNTKGSGVPSRPFVDMEPEDDPLIQVHCVIQADP